MAEEYEHKIEKREGGYVSSMTGKHRKAKTEALKKYTIKDFKCDNAKAKDHERVKNTHKFLD